MSFKLGIEKTKMKKIPTLALMLVVIGLGSLVAAITFNAYYFRASQNSAYPPQYGMMGQYNQQFSTQLQSNSPITIEQAKSIAQRYLESTGNGNLAIKEIMEFQYNFYVAYYEKNTGLGAAEMLIWKQSPPYGMMGSGMMGGYAVGSIFPEPGPNMMWNTKYSFAGGMMDQGMMHTAFQSGSPVTISKDKAVQLAQAYLDNNLKDATAEEDATQFYGYYTIDFTVNGKTAGMVSVNGYTGQVWYHSWHGDFVQEVQFN